MLLRQETRNIISGLLITIAIHLLVLITFLVTKINDVNKKRSEPLVIELDKETYKQLQQMYYQRCSNQVNPAQHYFHKVQWKEQVQKQLTA